MSSARRLLQSLALGFALFASIGSIFAAPSITTQPGVVTATSGANATFTVAATGSGTLSYQWRHLGKPITGTNTRTLTLASVKMADAGFYDVMVTAGGESTVSQAGRLMVNPVGGYPNSLRLDTTFTPLFEQTSGGAVQAVAVAPSGEAYAGGKFTMIAGQRRYGLARFSSALALDAAFAPALDGQVNAVLVQPDGKVVIGGTFTMVNGVACNSIARLNTDGTLDTSFTPGAGFAGPVQSRNADFAGPVQALARQGDGKLLVGGNFYSANGVSRSNIARLNTDGTLDTAFGASSSPNDGVTSLVVQNDGKVLIGGSFTSLASISRNYLARLNADGSLDTAFVVGSGFDGPVYSLALQADGMVVVGGLFTTYNGATCPRIARIAASGALDPTFTTGTGFNGGVRSVAVLTDGRIAATGYSNFYNGTGGQEYLSVLTSTGAIDPTFAPASRPDSYGSALVAQAGGSFIEGGYFQLIGSTQCSGLAKFTSTGTVIASAAAGVRSLGSISTAVPVAGGKWVVGGSFQYVNGTARNNIARLNANGSLDTTFDPGSGFNGGVISLAVQGDERIVAGGRFTSFAGTPRNSIARLNAAGTLDTGFDPGSGFDRSGVYSLALQADGRIVAGGSFTTFGGMGRSKIARLNVNGTLDAGFNPGWALSLGSVVLSLALQTDGGIVAGGWFDGTTRNYIARFNTGGTLDTTFASGTGFNDAVQLLAAQADGPIVAGGSFSSFDGTTRNYIARLNPDGTLDTGFDPGSGFNSGVYSLALQTDGRIVAGGSFTSYNGVARNYLARVQPNGALDATFTAYDLTSGSSGGAQYTDDGRLLVIGGSATRGAAVQSGLIMLKAGVSPVAAIATPPATQATSAGGTVTFSVTATGDGTLSYQWFKDGAVLSGATGSSLALTNVQLADVANYTVTVANSLGSQTSIPVTITGPTVPIITQQPSVLEASIGGNATLNVVATGTALTYQWFHNGMPIAGATSSALTLNNITVAAQGFYDVVVMSGGLSATRSALGRVVFPGRLWGSGAATALGIGVTGQRDTPKEVASGVAQAFAGFLNSFYLKTDGTLWAMGANQYGQLGDGTTVARAIPVQVATDVAQVAAGNGHTLFLKRDGSLWAVGQNSSGQLGNNSTTDSLTLVPVATAVAQISAGYDHSAFVKTDGSLWVFGGNGSGQLGDGAIISRLVPSVVTSGVKQVCAGVSCTAFVKTDGTLWGMGGFSYIRTPAQLDTGVASAAATPGGFYYVKTDGTLWSRLIYSSATQVDTGVAAVAIGGWGGWGGWGCYFKTDGTMRTASGQVVASGVASIAASAFHRLFIKTDGTLWSMGYNFGALGDGNSIAQSSPAYITDQVVAAAGGSSNSFALKSDGALWASGTNTFGQLGDGTTTSRSTPVQVATGVAAMAASDSHSLFLKTDGTLWAMGSNSVGQLGDGTTTNRSSPVQVASGVATMAAGGSHSLFIKTDGTLWAMGYNSSGQLGNGTASYILQSTPVQVATGVAAVKAGTKHSLFLKTDGTLWAMGQNNYGQLGDGTTTDRSTPVQIANNVAAVAAGYNHSLFLKTGGTLWATGDNSSGQLGDGSTTNHSTPVQVATGVAAMEGGYSHSIFLKTDGSLWAMGSNGSGLLGDGTTTDRSTPVQVASGITGIAAGVSTSLFIQQPGFGTAPAITTPPQSVSVARGANCSLSVVVSGTGPIGYQWYKAGVAMLGARSSQLNFVYTTESDVGSYTVVATNASGNNAASLPATITLGLPPVITGQPVDATAVPGATATFTVAATGGGTLGYEWYRNGVMLAGATGPTLTLVGVTPADFGAYSAVVFNTCGRIGSAQALLTVGSAGGPAYRLLDYFHPLAVGNRWTYVGPDWGSDETHSRVIVADLAKSVTCYDNAQPAQPVTKSVVSLVKAFGILAGGFTAAETWWDYYTVEHGHLVFQGDDENSGAKQLRASGGVAFPATLTIGQSSWWSGRLVGNGTDQGPVQYGVQLVGVESAAVPAGTYANCLHLRVVTILNDPHSGRVLQTDDEWWAAGIGMVKHHRLETGGWTEDQELLSTNLAAPMAPVLTGAPAGATIASGASATLSVGAGGTAPLSYQWYRGDSGDTASPIAGATTASFTTPALTAWARYWVRVTNPYGTADSATALVKVTGGTMTVADWTAQGTLTAAQRAPLASPAGDGVTNLMKFALGVLPLESAEARLPVPVKISVAGVPVALALDFTINPHAQDVLYILEVSDNMVTWTEAASITEPRGTNPDGTQLVRLREAVPPVALRRFARLKVEMVSP
jgi:uncharacterized delta-60 repeat protein